MSKYALLNYRTSNIGDEIQSVAAKRFLPSIDYLVDRDDINASDIKEETKLILNGWFSCKPDNWPPKNKNIKPLFISFHISNLYGSNAARLLNQESIEYYKEHEPIGCRDLHTVDLLREKGVKAYFSGCLTLTLNKKTEGRTNNICVVDMALGIKKQIPPEILVNTLFLTHVYRDRNLDRFALAQDLLDKYSTAKLVITCRLHCTLPCIAFGTPVIFINNDPNDPRFGGLTHRMKFFYTDWGFNKEIANIDWQNPAPNPYNFSAVRALLTEKCTQFIGDNSPPKQKDVTVIIGIKNRYDYKIINALKSVRNQTYKQDLIKIVLVDYGSDNKFRPEFQRLCERFRVNGIWAEVDDPWSRARCLNIGLMRANTQYILSSDVDIIFEKNYIQECVNNVSTNAPSCVHSVALASPKGSITSEIKAEDYGKIKEICVPYKLAMGVLFFEKQWANIIDGYDEFYQLWGCEDNDFVERLQRYGVELRDIGYKTYYIHQYHLPYDGVKEYKDFENIKAGNYDHWLSNQAFESGNCKESDKWTGDQIFASSIRKNINSKQENKVFRRLAFTTRVGCSIDCKICPQKKLIEHYSKRSDIVEMSLDLFKIYLGNISKDVLVKFSGFSDPFLNKSCIDMIDYAFNEGFKRVGVLGTFEGANLDIIKRLAKYRLSEFCIHVADCDGHSKIIVNDEYYEKMEFVAANFPYAQYVSHSQPDPKISEIMNKYNKKITVIIVNHRAGNLDGIKTGYKEGKITCGNEVLSNTNIVLPNGDVVLCCQDYSLENILGNLSSEKYEDIIKFDNPRYKVILDKMNSEKEYTLCRKCTFVKGVE